MKQPRRFHFFDELRQDVRYGARVLARSPGFAFVVVLILGFGFGTSATIFSFVNSLVIRPCQGQRTNILAS